MIPPDKIQAVKEAAQVEEVVGEFVALKRKGPRFLGLCPFHNEKTPSFTVSPALGIYKCFGCGEAGDSINFLRKHEHLSYVEAIKWLASRYGIELPEEEASPEQLAEQSERESVAVVQNWARNWSVDQLWNTDEGRRIGLGYFEERGFSEDTIRRFELGYVPERGDAFATAALAHGFLPEVLEKAGWIKRRENGKAWDFFQGRVTFPVHGLSGQVIAFGARTLRNDKKLAKYFNSPESALYVKSRSLYGIHFAKRSISAEGNCYLVEGYTDVLAMAQAGVSNVVASSGTSLTEDQVRLIKRYAGHVTILYDGDAAGMKASLRGIDMILAEGLGVKVVSFPEGDDPDSFIRKQGEAELQGYLRSHARDFLVFKTDLLVDGAGNDPVAKAGAIHEIVESISKVPDHVLRSLYLKECSSRLGVSEQALISELNKLLRVAYRKRLGRDQVPEELAPAIRPPEPEKKERDTSAQERDLLRMLLCYGHERIVVPFQNDDGSTSEEETTLAETMFTLLAVDDILFDQPLFKEIYLDYRHTSNLGQEVERGRYAGHDKDDWRNLAIDLLSDRYTLSPNWREKHRIHVSLERDNLLDALEEAIDILRERRVDRMIREKQDRLKSGIGAEEERTVLGEIRALSEAKRALAKRTGRVVVG
ncbi:MAG: DNA primase [Flavobacteriales bacterium]|nr:DNA primase [Flavobacteriales bacterium]